MSGGILSVFGFLLALSLASPAFAQIEPINLHVDQSVASASDTLKFTITWLETSVVKIDFTKVELQYRKTPQTTWTTFATTEGSPRKLNLVLPTRGGSGSMREFTVNLADIIGQAPSDFVATYQFRVVDRHYPTNLDASLPAYVSVNNQCSYSTSGSLVAIPGAGYRVVGAADVYVKVKEGNTLGTGTKILYDFSVNNLGAGCGASQSFAVTVFSNDATNGGVSDRNSGESIFNIISMTSPDGKVTPSPSTSVRLPTGKTIFRIEVDAPSDIAPGVQAYRVVTFRATNVDAQSAGQAGRAEASVRVTADTVFECRDDNLPIVSITPVSKAGDPGDQLTYTVEIRNQDTGDCGARTINLNKIGLQELLPPASDYDYAGEGARVDSNGIKWAITLRGVFDDKIADAVYRYNGKFTQGSTSYLGFTPSSGASPVFRLSPADAGGSSDRKVMILKVTSSGSETKEAQRGIRICMSDGCGGQSAIYDLQNRYSPSKKPSQASQTIPDSVLTNYESGLPASTGGSGGGTGGGGVPISQPKPTIQIDPAWQAKCKACAVQPGKGFNTDSQACVDGDASGSGKVDFARAMVNPSDLDGKSSTGKNNWIFLPTENSRQIVKDAARKRNAYTCEKPPAGVGLSSSTTSTSPTSPTTSPVMSDKPSHESCLACVKLANKGYVSTTGRCEAGKSTGSSESTASIGAGDWIYFSTDTLMNSVVTARPDLYSRGLSCDKMKQTTTTSTTPTSPATAPVASGNPSYDSCLACVKQANKGYVSTTGRCEAGKSVGSSESSASVAAKTWIYFSSDSIMNSVVTARPDLYSTGFSCEVMKNTDAPKACSSWTLCSTCTQGTTDACGWDKTTGTCKIGNDQRSSDESASLSKNNWVWYNTENDRGSGAGLSCEKSVLSPTSTTPSLSSCLACVKLANKGYVSTTGRCEAGKSAGSSESTASVSSGNWVYFSSDAIMNSVVTARPDLYSTGFSCQGKFSG